MSDKEKREKLHEILDLVLDINDFEERRKDNTGDKPTVFMNFEGHSCKLCVDVYPNGWESFQEKKRQGVEEYKKYLADGTFAFDDSFESIISSLDTLNRKERQKQWKQCVAI